jgi:hypothetical protein
LLADRLTKFVPAHVTESIIDIIAQRMAAYKRGDWEDDPSGTRYFTLEREELKIG